MPFSHQAMKDSLWRECKVPHFDFTASKKRNDYFGASAKEKGLKDQKPTAGTVRRLPNIPLCPVPEGCLGLCGSRRDADPRQKYDALDCDGGALNFFHHLHLFLPAQSGQADGGALGQRPSKVQGDDDVHSEGPSFARGLSTLLRGRQQLAHDALNDQHGKQRPGEQLHPTTMVASAHYPCLDSTDSHHHRNTRTSGRGSAHALQDEGQRISAQMGQHVL